MAEPQRRFAFSTLLTRASYLSGVVILAHTLKKCGSQYPLLVYYTPSLSSDAVKALELEAPKTNLILKKVELLLPRADVEVTLIAERFGDTWTKLRVFDCTEYDTVCYLDADMAIYKNMDTVFSNADQLPHDWIAANHACVCNLDGDAWAPEEWTKENCAYTPLSHPDALSHPTQPKSDSRPTYHLLNSGMFLYHPSKELWDDMLHFFNTTDKLGTYKFPDQDFLADFFRNRWQGLGWQYNALKTMRYWHTNIWRDDEVVCLHYIVDKPWTARVGEDGVAGYKGRDGETHTWWWNEYVEWAKQRQNDGGEETLKIVNQYLDRGDGTENSDPDMRAIGSKVQAFANNKAPASKEKIAGGKDESKQHDGNGLPEHRQKGLGEHGHGSVVHPSGRGQMPL